MASVNKVIILGHLGRDPETRYQPDGAAITNVSIATSSKYKNKSGEAVEETEWHRVVFFGRLAEVAGEYLKKGSAAYVEGRLKTNKYTDKDGVEKYSTQIIASSLQLLGSKDHADNRQSDASDKPAKSQGASSKFDDMDDDIPF